uniref:Uncharacterized protein n=1 Tax=Chryseobacterium endophyticum TaxID=1854762 RepID=A0AAU6WNL5_9FLAO
MFSSLALVVLMSAGVSAQNIPMDASVKTGTLPNGMKYYVKKNTLPEKRWISVWPSMPDPFSKMKTSAGWPTSWNT